MDKEFFILYFVASDALLSGRLVPCKWNQAWRPSELYMCIEREKVDFKSREVNCLKECALALRDLPTYVWSLIIIRPKLVCTMSIRKKSMHCTAHFVTCKHLHNDTPEMLTKRENKLPLYWLWLPTGTVLLQCWALTRHLADRKPGRNSSAARGCHSLSFRWGWKDPASNGDKCMKISNWKLVVVNTFI